MRAVALTALVLLLAGCVPNEPTVTARPPTVDPVFASDEEALAAAVEAYERYQAALDAALSGQPSAEIETLAIEPALSEANGFIDQHAMKNLTQVGTSTVVDGQLVYWEQHPSGGIAQIQIYVCLDISAVDVENASGLSVVQDNRRNRIPETVLTVWDQARQSVLVQEREERPGDC